jgi:hypothetical protein
VVNAFVRHQAVKPQTAGRNSNRAPQEQRRRPQNEAREIPIFPFPLSPKDWDMTGTPPEKFHAGRKTCRSLVWGTAPGRAACTSPHRTSALCRQNLKLKCIHKPGPTPRQQPSGEDDGFARANRTISPSHLAPGKGSRWTSNLPISGMGAGATRDRAHFFTLTIGTLPPELESKFNDSPAPLM